jgi:hypothetical protein
MYLKKKNKKSTSRALAVLKGSILPHPPPYLYLIECHAPPVHMLRIEKQSVLNWHRARHLMVFTAKDIRCTVWSLLLADTRLFWKKESQ